MTPKILMIIMAGLCLVAIPYLFITFKQMWATPNTEEYEAERKRKARIIIVILGILGTLAFLMPLLLKMNSDYQQP